MDAAHRHPVARLSTRRRATGPFLFSFVFFILFLVGLFDVVLGFIGFCLVLLIFTGFTWVFTSFKVG